MDNLLTFYDQNKSPVRILPVMAACAEYGDKLRALGVKPVIIGVGPIQAAMNMMAVLKEMEAKEGLPDLVLNIGSAGSNTLTHKAIYQASHISYRDMDASSFGFEKGQTPFSTLPALLPVSVRLPGIRTASVSTGAKVVSGTDYDSFAEDAAEMEAYAIYSVCLSFGIPMIKLFGISDGKEALTGKLEEWTDFLHDIDIALAQAIESMRNGLANGHLSIRALMTLPPLLQKFEKEAAA